MELKTARRIVVNFASLMASQIIARLIQLAIFVLLARSLRKEDFGVFSFGFAFSLVFVIVADFGLSLLLVREISRDKKLASKYLSNSIIAKILFSIVTLIFAYLFLDIMNYSQEVKTVAYIMLLFSLLQSFTEVYFSIYRAFEKMHYDALIKVIRMVLLIGAVFYLIQNGYGIVAASMAFLITEIIVLLIAALITYTKFVRVSFDFDYEFTKQLIKESSIFFFSVVFTTIYLYIDQIFISKFRDTTEVGVYSAAANIVIMLIFIPQMYVNSIFPVISRFYINSKESLKLAYEKSFKYMFVFGLSIAAGIYVLADKIILFLYGKEFSEAVIVLKILAGYSFLKFLNPVTGYTLIAINKQGTRLFGQASAAVINIVLNIIWIPIYGIVGAAMATLITEIIFFLMYSGFIYKYGFGFKFLAPFIYKPLIATGIMVFSLQFIGNLFLAVIAGFLIYCAILLFLGIIDNEDKRIFYKIVKNI